MSPPKNLYHSYSRELSSYGYGIALWHPEPDKEWGRVELADVGYVRGGKFWRLFNASLPADHDSHKKYGVPEYFEQLDIECDSCYELDAQTLGRMSSSTVGVGAGITGSVLPLGGSVEFSDETPRAASLVLNTPLIKDYILHHSGAKIENYILKHNEMWNIFANRTHGRGVKAQQIMLVTHCYRTASWTASYQPSATSENVDLSVSGGIVGAVQASFRTWFSRRSHLQPIKKSGPPPPDAGAPLANTETVFVDGMVLSRLWNRIWLSVQPLNRRFDWLVGYGVPGPEPLSILYGHEIFHAAYYAPDYRAHRQPICPCMTYHGSHSKGLLRSDVLEAIRTLEKEHEPSITSVVPDSNNSVVAAWDRDPLQMACHRCDVPAVLSILRSPSCEPLHQYSKAPFGSPLVAAAAGSGDMALLLILLDYGADINAYFPNGGYGTALHVAAQRGDEYMVQYLLDAGANVDIDVTSNGVTPLHVAIDWGHFSIVHLLLERGASLKTAFLGDCAKLLEVVVSEGEADLLKTILDHVKLDVQAAQSALISACKRDTLPCAELLLDRGIPINFVPEEESLLEIASAHNALRVAQCLLDRGADVNAEGGTARGSPLIAAAASGHTTMVDILLANGANINVEGPNRGRALHVASAHGRANVVARLLQHGADIDVRYSGSGARGSAIDTAVYRGHIDVVRIMLEHDPLVLKRQDDHHHSLHATSFSGLTEDERIHVGALQIAAYTGRTDILEILLDHGANVNLQEHQFGNALQIAIAFHHHPVIDMLLDRGADIEAVGVGNMTALQTAEYLQDEGLASLLLQRGAKPHQNGVAPLPDGQAKGENAAMVEEGL